MDPLSLLTAAVAFVGAETAKKCGGLLVDQAFAGIKAILKVKLGREPQPSDLTPDTLRAVKANANDDRHQGQDRNSLTRASSSCHSATRRPPLLI
jgi:hypothetical protein